MIYKFKHHTSYLILKMHSLKFIFIMHLLIFSTDTWRRRRRTKWFSIIPQDQNFQNFPNIFAIVKCRWNKYYFELYSHISFSLSTPWGLLTLVHYLFFFFSTYWFILVISFFKKHILSCAKTLHFLCLKDCLQIVFPLSEGHYEYTPL